MLKNGKYLTDSTIGQIGVLDGKVVLDAGCGGGNKTLALAKGTLAKMVIGIDGSVTAINAARSLAERMNVKNVIFIHGFMEDSRELLRIEGYDTVDFVFNSF